MPVRPCHKCGASVTFSEPPPPTVQKMSEQIIRAKCPKCGADNILKVKR